MTEGLCSVGSSGRPSSCTEFTIEPSISAGGVRAKGQGDNSDETKLTMGDRYLSSNVSGIGNKIKL